MPALENHPEAAVWAATSSRMAGSLMAEYLAASLRRTVVTSPPEQLRSARVTVLLSAVEEPNTVPRVLRSLTAGRSRVILSYDGTSRADEILDTAERFGVWSVFDAREDVRGLVDLIRRGLSSSSSSRRASSSAFAPWRLPASTERPGLTRRERDVIRLLCADEPLDTDVAARELGISVHTINVHLGNVRRKLEGRYTGNRTALRDALIDVGWLEC